jgi:ribosomal protein S18 acetylase RimI-like enzyme
MLNSDSNAIFNVFSEPLANTLGLFSHSAVGYEVGALLDDDNNVCGYALFTSTKIVQFYVAPDFRMQGHGRAMLEALKQIYKERNTAIIDIPVSSSEQARSFWKACGACCEDANSQLWCIELDQ